MIRGLTLMLGFLAMTASPGIGPGSAQAAGPWRGQVVDAETGQPLAGVVVVAVWDRLSPGVVHQARHFHDVDEVVTDAEGRFVLPERDLSPPNPFTTIEGPRLIMFKGGYGRWRFHRSRTTDWPTDTSERMRRFDEAMRTFGRTGAVFELPELKTREERRGFLSSAESPPLQAPGRRILRYLEARDDERAIFGLERLKEGYLKWEERRKESLR